MSENTNTTTETPAAQEQSLNIDKGPYYLEHNGFSGANEGFNYYSIQYKDDSEEVAKASLEHILTRWTAQQVVGMLNTTVKASTRVKALGNIPKFDNAEKTKLERNKLLQSNPTLLSADDADTFVPGTRELGIQGMMRKIGLLQKEGKFTEAMNLLMQVQVEIAKQAQESAEEASQS